MYNCFWNFFEPGASVDILDLWDDLLICPCGLECYCSDPPSSSLPQLCYLLLLLFWLVVWVCVCLCRRKEDIYTLLLLDGESALTCCAAILLLWKCRSPPLRAQPPGAQLRSELRDDGWRAPAVTDRPSSPRGCFSEGLQRQRGFSKGRETNMTLAHTNKIKLGLISVFFGLRFWLLLKTYTCYCGCHLRTYTTFCHLWQHSFSLPINSHTLFVLLVSPITESCHFFQVQLLIKTFKTLKTDKVRQGCIFMSRTPSQLQCCSCLTFSCQTFVPTSFSAMVI